MEGYVELDAENTEHFTVTSCEFCQISNGEHQYDCPNRYNPGRLDKDEYEEKV